MLTVFIWLFTAILFLDCLLLGLLILIQLPKKEAGLGMAFGGGAADALFGAGSGNTLTKLTKWCAGIFLALVLALSVMNTRAHKSSLTDLDAATKRAGAAQQPVGTAPTPASTQQAEAPTPAGNTNAAPIMTFGSNATPAAGTNAAPVPTNLPPAAG